MVIVFLTLCGNESIYNPRRWDFHFYVVGVDVITGWTVHQVHSSAVVWKEFRLKKQRYLLSPRSLRAYHILETFDVRTYMVKCLGIDFSNYFQAVWPHHKSTPVSFESKAQID